MLNPTVYVGHARSFDYQKELYAPLQQLALEWPHVNLMLPHASEKFIDSRALFEKGQCALFIAEISHASTGLGMELAYASVFNVPIVCLYKNGAPVNASIRSLNAPVHGYLNQDELVQQVRTALGSVIDLSLTSLDAPSSVASVSRRPRVG